MALEMRVVIGISIHPVRPASPKKRRFGAVADEFRIDEIITPRLRLEMVQHGKGLVDHPEARPLELETIIHVVERHAQVYIIEAADPFEELPPGRKAGARYGGDRRRSKGRAWRSKCGL